MLLFVLRILVLSLTWACIPVLIPLWNAQCLLTRCLTRPRLPYRAGMPAWNGVWGWWWWGRQKINNHSSDKGVMRYWGDRIGSAVCLLVRVGNDLGSFFGKGDFGPELDSRISGHLASEISF